MKNEMLGSFKTDYHKESVKIAGAELGKKSPKIEGILALNELGEYYMKSHNNKRGECELIILTPIDSQRQFKWLDDNQVAEIFKFLEKKFDSVFNDPLLLKDGTQYFYFRIGQYDEFEIRLVLKKIDGPVIQPEIINLGLP